MFTPRLSFLPGLVGLALFTSAGAARGQLVITADIPVSSVTIGQTFDVTLTISGFSSATEVDGWDLRVTYDDSLASFVGPFDFGTTSAGPTQQWLAMSSQESVADGFDPDSNGNALVPGLVTASLTDLGFSLTERGTTAGLGFLVSFTMQADALGTVTLAPNAPVGGTVFFDVDLAGLSLTPDSFQSDSVTIIPEPRSAAFVTLFGLLGWRLLRARRARP
jgi:hypothetical protein